MTYDFSKAKRGPVVKEAGKTRITIRIDDDILGWFRTRVADAGRGNYQTLINDTLRAYIATQGQPQHNEERRSDGNALIRVYCHVGGENHRERDSNVHRYVFVSGPKRPGENPEEGVNHWLSPMCSAFASTQVGTRGAAEYAELTQDLVSEMLESGAPRIRQMIRDELNEIKPVRSR